jgi:homoserine dehydrogenase
VRQVRIGFIGVGNVARALARLLAEKRSALAAEYGAEILLAGVATRRWGFRVTPPAFGIENLIASPEMPAAHPAAENVERWLKTARPDVVFEMSSLNPADGEPALSYLRAALQAGAHVVTANKGPVAYGYSALSALAAEKKRRFLFEATCLAGAPFFSLFRETRPLCRLTEVRAIVNVTANLVLRAMEEGMTFEEGVKKTQEMGLAETDPSNDVDGWDAAVKISIVAQVLMGRPVLPADVRRTGIRGVTRDEMRAAAARGEVIRLVARAARRADGGVEAAVAPVRLGAEDALRAAGHDGLIAECLTDTMPPTVIAARNISPVSTAYDVLADFVTTLRQPTP